MLAISKLALLVPVVAGLSLNRSPAANNAGSSDDAQAKSETQAASSGGGIFSALEIFETI